VQNVLLLIPDFAPVLAVSMGGDGPEVAWLISVGTLAAMVTLSFRTSQLAQ
jgi:hypothetical protein